MRSDIQWVYILMFGPQKIMGGDKGTEFVNKFIEQLCNACGIEYRVTSTYHPQANGCTERFIGTLIKISMDIPVCFILTSTTRSKKLVDNVISAFDG